MGFFDTVAEKAKKISEDVGDAANIARINNEIKKETALIDEEYRMIGNIVYEKESGLSNKDYSVHISKIDGMLQHILFLNGQLEQYQKTNNNTEGDE